MWKHWCKFDKNIISVEQSARCNWCNKLEEEVPSYPYQFYIYPAQKLVDWPTAQAYYYGLGKNKS